MYGLPLPSFMLAVILNFLPCILLSLACTLSLIALVIGRMKEDGIGKWEKDVEFYLQNWNAGEHFGKSGANVGEISKYKLDTNIRPGLICLFGRNLLRTPVQLPAVVSSFIIVMRIQFNVVEHCSSVGC